MAGKRIAVFSLFALLALALAVFASGGSEAQTYNPYNSYTVTSAGAGDAADSLNTIGIPAPDLNYEDSSMFSFNPVDWVPAAPGSIPIGAGMGVLDANVAVGMFAQGCKTALHPIFNLYNASVDNSAANILAPADMYWVLKNKDDYPVPYSKWNAQLPDYLEGYPHFVNEMLDPDGSGPKPPLKPVARYAGHGVVANMNILIQFVVLDPGQLTELGGVFTQLGAAVGRPNIIVLNNPVSQEEAPGAISDFCTPLKTVTTLYAITTDNPETTTVNESGTSAQTNPAANTGVLLTGTHMARNYSLSERDADGDGIENDLDPCPYTSDVGWDPRIDGAQPGFDSDNDHLPDSCDPDPNGAGDPDPIDCAGAQTDCDNDGYDNGQDICPLVANGCKTSSCGPVFNAAWDNQADDDNSVANADLGPRPDSIGNACDDSDDDGREDGAAVGTCNDGIDNGGDTVIDGNDPDCIASAANGWTGMDKGEIAHGNTSAQIWGTNPGTGSYHHGMPWAAVCIGATDTDGDGYCDALETLLGSDPNDGAETGTECDGNADDDGDTYVNDGCPQVGKYIETGAECLDAVSNDTPTPDATEQTLGAKVNDGCPVIGVPESLVIDVQINAPLALPQANVPQSCSDEVDNDNDGASDFYDPGCNNAAPIEAVPLPASDSPNRWRPWAHNKVVEKNIVCVKIDNALSADMSRHNGWFQVGAPQHPKFSCDPLGPAPIPAPANPGFIPNVQWNDLDHSSDNVAIDKTVTLAGIAPVPCLVGLDANPPGAGPVSVGPLNEYEPKGWSTEPRAYLPTLRFSIGLPPGQASCNYRFTVVKVPKPGYGVTFVAPAEASISGQLQQIVPEPADKEIVCVKVDSRPWVQVGAPAPGQPWACASPPVATIPAQTIAGWANPGVKDLQWDDLDWSSADVGIDKTVTLQGIATGPTGVACLVGLDGNQPAGTGPVSVGPLNEYEPAGCSTEPPGYLTDLQFSIAVPPQQEACDYQFTVTKVPKPGFSFTGAQSRQAIVTGQLQADRDKDGVVDVSDNCAKAGTTVVWNPEQKNSDADIYGNACDNCPATTDASQTNTDRNVLDAGGAWLQIGGKNAWYSDPLGDPCDSDDDNDFYSDTIETYLGTNTLDNCPKVTGPGTNGDSWPLDINVSSDLSVTGDVFNYVGRIGAKSGPNAYCPGPLTGNWLQRLDLNKSCDISVTGDVFQFVGRIGDKCN